MGILIKSGAGSSVGGRGKGGERGPGWSMEQIHGLVLFFYDAISTVSE
jgi:hypothetical protein